MTMALYDAIISIYSYCKLQFFPSVFAFDIIIILKREQIASKCIVLFNNKYLIIPHTTSYAGTIQFFWVFWRGHNFECFGDLLRFANIKITKFKYLCVDLIVHVSNNIYIRNVHQFAHAYKGFGLNIHVS